MGRKHTSTTQHRQKEKTQLYTFKVECGTVASSTDTKSGKPEHDGFPNIIYITSWKTISFSLLCVWRRHYTISISGLTADPLQRHELSMGSLRLHRSSSMWKSHEHPPFVDHFPNGTMGFSQLEPYLLFTIRP